VTLWDVVEIAEDRALEVSGFRLRLECCAPPSSLANRDVSNRDVP
jgi:hypothetical protein